MTGAYFADDEPEGVVEIDGKLTPEEVERIAQRFIANQGQPKVYKGTVPSAAEIAIDTLTARISRIEAAICQLYQIDRRYATPPADSIKGALEEILGET